LACMLTFPLILLLLLIGGTLVWCDLKLHLHLQQRFTTIKIL
jgi:hypothetical protein